MALPQTLLAIAILVAQGMLGLTVICTTWRLLKGPQARDRVLALDATYLTGMLLVVTRGIQTGRTIYFEMALIIAILGFAASVALAKFLLRGEIIE